MNSSYNTPTADLHTPEELLESAESMLASGTPRMMRAAVLEAITALEAYVQEIVFSALRNKFDPAFVQWLQDKTRMDFDARLSVITPVALGTRIDKTEPLWRGYKKAKEIRNKVTHSGLKVSSDDARFVINTVYNWLAYLGSTLELEIALFCLKRYVEENRICVENGNAAVGVIREYFGRTKAALTVTEPQIPLSDDSRPELRGDLILKFGSYQILVEARLIHVRKSSKQADLFAGSESLNRVITFYQHKSPFDETIEEMAKTVNKQGLTQGAVIMFVCGDAPSEFESPQVL